MKTGWRICVAAACVLVTSAAGALGDTVPLVSPVKRWEVTPTSPVAHGAPPLQKIDLTVESGKSERTWHGRKNT